MHSLYAHRQYSTLLYRTLPPHTEGKVDKCLVHSETLYGSVLYSTVLYYKLDRSTVRARPHLYVGLWLCFKSFRAANAASLQPMQKQTRKSQSRPGVCARSDLESLKKSHT